MICKNNCKFAKPPGPEHAPGEAEALAPGVQEDLLEGLVLPIRLALVALGDHERHVLRPILDLALSSSVLDFGDVIPDPQHNGRGE